MSRQSIINTAAAENGTKESPANSNKTKYGRWYGLDGEKWCAIFVSWVYDHAGHHMEAIDTQNGYQACQSGYNFWKKRNRLTKDPQPGDVVLYDWTGDGHCDHTGIFVQWMDAGKTRLQAWEGNTAKGNDSDGGAVMLRERNRSLVKAFAVPLALDGVTPVNVSDDDTLQRGDRGSAVSNLQKMLHELGANIAVDGIFGAGTEQAVKDFQQKHALPVTGIVTPEVLGNIQEAASSIGVPDKKITTGSFIRQGDSGAAVLSLQQALNRKGANPAIGEDGIFGRGTSKALKDFQRQNGLEVDGIAGPETFAALGLSDV